MPFSSSTFTYCYCRISPKKRHRRAETDEGNLEPVYCMCRQVAYGDMIACSNRSCPKEWFHVECVGVEGTSAAQLLAWYCPECREREVVGQ